MTREIKWTESTDSGPSINVQDITFLPCATCGVTLVMHPAFVKGRDPKELIDHHNKWHQTVEQRHNTVLRSVRAFQKLLHLVYPEKLKGSYAKVDAEDGAKNER